MLKKLCLQATLACSALAPLFAQQEYKYSVDLNQVANDQLVVTLQTPTFTEKTIDFTLPRMVPGTYSVYDFSRFVTDFAAYNRKGRKLKVSRSADGLTWQIKKAHKLSKIVYKVEDTWDTDKSNFIFEPAGTNIDSGNVFVFNNHGIFGFFKGYDRIPVHVEVNRPKNLFGGTSLERVGGDEDTDIFKAPHYHALVDAPIMFAPADTAQIMIGDTRVLIHTYSPTQRVSSKAMVKDIQPILEAQAEYLGKLPVNRYAFLVFLNPEGKSYKSGAAGALEHSYSSFYCMFEGEPQAIGQGIRDVAAHEFFHIVTPLAIHSEEIQYFDFSNPKMSEHLWLYEGVTEYSAQHVQVKQGLHSIEEFLAGMSNKLRTSKYFNDNLSFTEMSKTCLDANKAQYSNVYMKGALIGMCVDLKLRILSKGAYGIQNMMRDLANKYGVETPFKDSELFGEIAAVSKFPEIKDFLERHVKGTTPLPYSELLQAVGMDYLVEGTVRELSKFGIDDLQKGLDFDFKEKRIKVKSAEYLDAFGRDVLGLRGGDLLKMWNGKELTLNSINTILGTHDQQAKEGDDLTIVVLRKNEAGELAEIELKGKLGKVEAKKKHIFIQLPNPSAEQIALRKAWLGQ